MGGRCNCSDRWKNYRRGLQLAKKEIRVLDFILGDESGMGGAYNDLGPTSGFTKSEKLDEAERKLNAEDRSSIKSIVVIEKDFLDRVKRIYFS